MLLASCGNDVAKKNLKEEQADNSVDTLTTEKKQSPFEIGLVVNEDPIFQCAYMHYRTIDGVDLLPYQQTTNDLIVNSIGITSEEGTKKKKVTLKGDGFYRSIMKNFIASYKVDKEEMPGAV